MNIMPLILWVKLWKTGMHDCIDKYGTDPHVLLKVFNDSSRIRFS